ncbi:NUDIX domain-containing protein [Rhodobacteraceae bacterium XHP0102]|nr:NUDIX domain-containing protein [Rhodobacteraceae bacterium XHP0102]
MTDLALYGTLRDPDILKIVLGRAGGEMPSARLSGYRVAMVAGQHFPMIWPEAGAECDIALLQGLDGAALARLDFYEAVFGYRRAEIPHPMGALQIYLPPKDEHWPKGGAFDPVTWAEDHGALTRLAAYDIMSSFGIEAAKELALRLPIIRARAQAKLRAKDHPPAVSAAAANTTRDNFKIVRQDIAYHGFFNLVDIAASYPRYDGSDAAPAGRLILDLGEAVTVLPYDPARDLVLLIEQFRPAAVVQGDPNPWLWETVAGICDAGETYAQTAQREAREEAGITLGDLHLAGRYYPSQGAVAQILISYIGICELDPAYDSTHGLEAEGEDIRAFCLPFAEAYRLVHEARLSNAPLLLSLMALDRMRAEKGWPSQ